MLISIDVATGLGTVIGRVGFPNVFGLAFAPDGTLFGATDGNPPSLLVIDTTTGAGTAVGIISNASGMAGLTYSLVSRIPQGNAPNLVVLVHGCCTDANDVIEDWDSLGTLIADAIVQNQTPELWEIVVWDWSEDTLGLDFPGAYDAAEHQGRERLAPIINNYPYRHVHLIGHSAGAKLIQWAAEYLVSFYKLIRNIEDRPFIQLTFLDAYTQTELDSGQLGGEGYGYLEGYPEHYAEHYVHKGLAATDACLASAFNFDITDWDHSQEEGGFFGHHWPINWYRQSITLPEPEFKDLKYGYPLSLEGGNDQFDTVAQDFPPGQQCSLDEPTDCVKTNCPSPGRF